MQVGGTPAAPRVVVIQEKRIQASPVRMKSRIQQVWPLSLLLFALWVVLSEKFDLFHLGIGVMSSLCVALGTYRLLLLPPVIVPHGTHPITTIPWLRLLVYVLWLFWQIVLSSIQVAIVVVHPKMPISPCLIRFRTTLPHTLARLTLATSITLTPGTVTVDVEGDEFLVHALTKKGADELVSPEGEGAMHQRIVTLYRQAGTATQED
jgi:multicomponent Na+:H+ antiporter subunit E